MMGRRTGTVIAGCFALSAFIVAIMAGLLSGNATASTLTRALTAMLLCYPVGLIIGMICDRVVEEHFRAFQRSHALPDQAADGEEPSPLAPGGGLGGGPGVGGAKQETEDVLVV